MMAFYVFMMAFYVFREEAICIYFSISIVFNFSRTLAFWIWNSASGRKFRAFSRSNVRRTNSAESRTLGDLSSNKVIKTSFRSLMVSWGKWIKAIAAPSRKCAEGLSSIWSIKGKSESDAISENNNTTRLCSSSSGALIK